MPKRKFSAILFFGLVLFVIYYAHAFEIPKWFPFSEKNALDEWQEKVFKGKVLYSIQTEDQDGHLFAKSEKASSGLLYRIKFDITKSPMISWQWKVDTFPKKNDAVKVTDGWIERDDYAARVYVIFPSWNFLNIKSLEYIWDETYEEGTVLTSPYFKNIKLIVVESGLQNKGQWVFEERNIYEDYKNAFERRPPRYVGAVAIMTDSDNSLSTAEAYYQDLRVGYTNDETK